MIRKAKVVIFGNGNIGKSIAFQDKDILTISKKEINFLETSKMLLKLHLLLDDINILVIINCVGFNNIDQAEKNPEIAESVNAVAVGILGKYCQSRSVPLIHFSSDNVFSGDEESILLEDSPTSPVNVFGKTKLLGEQLLLEHCNKAIILRLSWVYSIYFNTNFIYQLIVAMTKIKKMAIVDDQFGSLANAFDIATIIQQLIYIIDNKEKQIRYGIYNLASKRYISKFEIAQEILNIGDRMLPDFFITQEITPISFIELDNKISKPKKPEMSSSLIYQMFNIKIPDCKFSLFNAVQKIANKIITNN